MTRPASRLAPLRGVDGRRLFERWIYPIGAACLVTLDDGIEYSAQTQSAATMLSDGLPVIAVAPRLLPGIRPALTRAWERARSPVREIEGIDLSALTEEFGAIVALSRVRPPSAWKRVHLAEVGHDLDSPAWCGTTLTRRHVLTLEPDEISCTACRGQYRSARPLRARR